MAKNFRGLGKGPAPKLTDFEKEMYDAQEKKEINEVHVIKASPAVNDEHELAPFSTRISKGLYKKVRQFEYWERMRITEIVEQALQQYLEGKETAEKPLPERELKRKEGISKSKKRKS